MVLSGFLSCTTSLNCTGDSVRQEVSKVMGYARPGVANISTSVKVLPTMKPKPEVSRKAVAEKMVKVSSFDKQLQVFRYMGTSSPKSFVCTPENIVITGMLPSLNASLSESEIRKEIGDVICTDSSVYNSCSPQDFEFIHVSRRSAQVPTVKAGYTWDGNALKGPLSGKEQCMFA